MWIEHDLLIFLIHAIHTIPCFLYYDEKGEDGDERNSLTSFKRLEDVKQVLVQLKLTNKKLKVLNTLNTYLSGLYS